MDLTLTRVLGDGFPGLVGPSSSVRELQKAGRGLQFSERERVRTRTGAKSINSSSRGLETDARDSLLSSVVVSLIAVQQPTDARGNCNS